MGILISKAVEGVGSLLGNTVLSPLKRIFGQSCEGVCTDAWDIICFIEHLCISSLANLFMVIILSYITVLFFYVLLKVGVIQCVIRSLFKMTWTGCNAYIHAMREVYFCLWHTIKSTKRVHRGRRRILDLEEGRSSSMERGESDFEMVRSHEERRVDRDHRRRRKEGSYSWKSSFSSRHGGKGRSRRSGSHSHGVRLRTREVTAHVKGSRSWKAKQDRLSIRRDGDNKKRRMTKRRRSD